MGSENPKQIDRRLTVNPVRLYPGSSRNTARKSLSATAGSAATIKVPKTALTPISRLKKFQKLRDKNLRKQVLSRNNIRQQLKMLDGVEVQQMTFEEPPVITKAFTINDFDKVEKELENGCKENGQNGLNGIEELEEPVNGTGESHNGVDENGGEVRRSPRKGRGKEEEIVVDVVTEDPVEVAEPVVNGNKDLHEPRDLEVNVKVVDSPASSSKRRSTPRRTATPEIHIPSPLPPRELTEEREYFWDGGDFPRISGRRPIRGELTPPRQKRKSDEVPDEPSSKRMAFTPSVPSPGWKFLSPFSLFRKTPRNRPVDDSLFVNVSSDSEADLDLDTSNVSEAAVNSESHSPDDSIERPTTEAPSKASTSWLCRIM